MVGSERESPTEQNDCSDIARRDSSIRTVTILK